MSKAAPQTQREERALARKERRKVADKARKALRKECKRLGVPVPTGVASGNGISPFETIEEEQAARQEAATVQLGTLQRVWPTLSRRLAKIPDLRRPKSVTHAHTVLLLYGILMFVFQQSSRREANRKMTKPQFRENLRLWFPEIEKLPHQDTLNRVLVATEPSEIEAALVGLMGELVRKKKFARYLVEKCYPICMDGTQKLKRNELICAEWLTRTLHTADGSEEQHYVYVLEVSLAFRNGMTIPVLSEFLTYNGGSDETKQDCEQRAFHRAAARLKKAFPRLPILVLLDGLYANGPVLEACRRHRWQAMIVLKDGCLKSVWEEVTGLKRITQGNTFSMRWGNRRQHFTWINDISYTYDERGKPKRLTVHVVECVESWEAWDPKAEQYVTRTARHAWLSSVPLTRQNVHERCNLGARHRWQIEEQLLVEKHHGYHYEHLYSEDWNALRCYHYLLRIGHLINVLVWYSAQLARVVRRLGVRGLLQFVWTTLQGPWLDADALRARGSTPGQLRLI